MRGSQLVLGFPDTFCLWTRCARDDVTDRTARPKLPTDKVTCAECLAVAKEFGRDDGTDALSAEGIVKHRGDPEGANGE